MSIYQCRMLLPQELPWRTVEADTPEQAANEYHFGLPRWESGKVWIERDGEGTRTDVYFARIEVEGHGSWVSRVYQSGLWRRGGVPVQQPTLADLAAAIDWPHDPQELVQPGWDFEEDWSA